MITRKHLGVDIFKATRILSYHTPIQLIKKIVTCGLDFRSCQIDEKVCFIYSFSEVGRSDYDSIAKSFYNLVPYKKKKFISPRAKFSILYLYKFTYYFLLEIFSNYLKSHASTTLKDSVLIALAKAKIEEVFDVIDERSTKLLVTFCDAHFEDNIATQIASIKGIKTATLQHGQYHILDQDVPENCALQNIVSDYLFSWGPATLDEYLNHVKGKTKVLPLGLCSPEFFNTIPYNSCSTGEYNYNRVLSVYLNADNQINKNLNMLGVIIDFCDNKNYKFTVRYHPKNDTSRYQSLLLGCKSFVANPVSSDNFISIIYTSGVFVKLLSNAKHFFLFKDSDTPNIFFDNILGFSNLVDLTHMVEYYQNNITGYCDIMEKSQRYFIAEGNVETNYKDAIEHIINEDL